MHCFVKGKAANSLTKLYDVLGMIRQLGLPTWFLTLSAADMQWPDVIQTIARQYGTTFTDEQVAAMSFDEKSKWLRQNPVTAARHFQYRLNTFFQVFLKSKANPLGELVDYAIRIEFQARGSPHAHTILWIKGAPKLGVNSDQEVCDFIEHYVHCNIPQDDGLAQLVSKVQKHKHSATCRRNGHCRFHYPRPPSPVTVIARKISSTEEANEAKRATEAKAALLAVRKVLEDKDTADNISLDELLIKAGVPEAIYLQGLKISSTGTSVVMQREPSQAWINTYNLDVIAVWKANMDLQYILDPYACVMYIASYMLKSEKSMGELLKQVSKECRAEQIKTQLRRIGSVFLNHREVSAQEAVYRILSLPLKQLSRKVIFVNASPKEDRVTLLKPASQLERIEDESEDIYQTSLIDRYAARPDSLDDMCLAEFAANYTTRSGQEPDDETSDALPKSEREDKKLPRIQLKNGLGYMHKRGREAIIRFHRFNREKDAEKLYRSKLMLYLPWRNESTDLLGEYADFCSHYEDQSDVILANEQKYSHNASLIDEATDDLAEHGPPQHAWDLVAPGAAEQQARDQAEGVEVHHDIEQEDLDANARLLQQQQHSTPLTERFTAETSRDLLTPEEYRAAIRGLNSKQRQVVMFHREWCKSAITALRSGRPVKPYRVFLSGPGGVGKSHVISLIRNDTVKLLRLSGQLEPDDVIVLLTAPTGGAAFNILGMTLHSALLFSTAKFSNQPLTHDKLNTLRSKLSNLHLLIIDEVSMVGSNMLLEIHKRLQQLKGSNDDTTFGNVSILAVGDLFQLQPVAQPYVFDLVGDAYARLHKSGSLWTDEFSLLELDQIMRQKDDQQFAQLLGRVRKAECTDSDLDVLRSRACEESDPAYPHEAVHVYPLNKDVDEDNIRKLNRLAPEDQHVVIHAKDCTKDKHTRQLDMTMPKSKASTGGLVSELHLAVGAKVMLTVNVDVSDGLVNGARGTVEAIIRTGNQVSLVLVKFDHQRVGIAAISRSQYQSEHPSSVPISRHEALFNIGRNKTVQVSRRQFPLVLSWASTIHKVQGLTLDQIVVDMKGRVFNAGQAYVAFSRVKSLQSLFIKNFNPASIKVSASVISEMERLTSDRLLPPEKTPQVVTLPRADWIKIGHLNVRSYFSKLEDITVDLSIAHADVMCFTETFLKPHHNVSGPVLNGEPSVVYRFDRNTTSTQDLSNGGVMIACASSLMSERTNVPHPPTLEVESILVNARSNLRICVIAVYRRPQLLLSTFLALFEDYLSNIQHHTLPTVILGDFNENLLPYTSSSRLLQFMSSKGFSQLVKVATTDSGSMLDHIYYNQPCAGVVEVIDTYYSDHDACFLSLPLASHCSSANKIQPTPSPVVITPSSESKSLQAKPIGVAPEVKSKGKSGRPRNKSVFPSKAEASLLKREDVNTCTPPPKKVKLSKEKISACSPPATSATRADPSVQQFCQVVSALLHGKSIASILLQLSEQLLVSNICDLVSEDSAIYNSIVQHLNSLPHVYASQQPHLQQDSSVLTLSHPVLFQTFKPVVTTGDGSCLYHALSLALTGTESCTLLMRLLTAHALVKHKDVVMTAFRKAYQFSSEGECELKFNTAVIQAVTVPNWGTDCHLFALSVLLGRPIFQYTTDPNHASCDATTVEQFAQMFLSRQSLTTRHLLYCTSAQRALLSSGNVSSLPLLPVAVFNMQNYHWVAMLPHSASAMSSIPIPNTRILED